MSSVFETVDGQASGASPPKVIRRTLDGQVVEGHSRAPEAPAPAVPRTTSEIRREEPKVIRHPLKVQPEETPKVPEVVGGMPRTMSVMSVDMPRTISAMSAASTDVAITRRTLDGRTQQYSGAGAPVVTSATTTSTAIKVMRTTLNGETVEQPYHAPYAPPPASTAPLVANAAAATAKAMVSNAAAARAVTTSVQPPAATKITRIRLDGQVVASPAVERNPKSSVSRSQLPMLRTTSGRSQYSSFMSSAAGLSSYREEQGLRTPPPESADFEAIRAAVTAGATDLNRPPPQDSPADIRPLHVREGSTVEPLEMPIQSTIFSSGSHWTQPGAPTGRWMMEYDSPPLPLQSTLTTHVSGPRPIPHGSLLSEGRLLAGSPAIWAAPTYMAPIYGHGYPPADIPLYGSYGPSMNLPPSRLVSYRPHPPAPTYLSPMAMTVPSLAPTTISTTRPIIPMSMMHGDFLGSLPGSPGRRPLLSFDGPVPQYGLPVPPVPEGPYGGRVLDIQVSEYFVNE